MKKIKIGLVDDHLLFRQTLEIGLKEDQDIEVVLTASDGLELLHKLKNSRPDIVLMDLKMPNMNGVEATKLVQQKYPKLKIIILSMFSDRYSIVELFENGINGYLSKTCELEKVREAIHKVSKLGFYFEDVTSEVLLQKIIRKKNIANGLIDIARLTDREIQVLDLICKERTTTEIANIMCLSPRTVEGYRNKLFEKASVKNIVGLVKFAIKNDLVQIGAPN
ncbi:MAG: response regulator transcription factor [Flavobacteriales bacterium]|nr:response regulator transcription factor [Flavobacteriales bacterium]